MPKQLYNINYNNLSVLPPPLVSSGYAPLQVLDSSSLSTLITQSNFSGNYYSLFPVTVSNLNIPSAGNLIYQLYIITSPVGSTITINLTTNPPIMDIGQVINIFNNTSVISYFNTQSDSTLIPILPQEWIKILVMSSTTYIIQNDKESYMQSQIGSYKDIIYNDASIAGLNARGWYRLDPAVTIGMSGISSNKKKNFKKFVVGEIRNDTKKNIKIYSDKSKFLDGELFYIAYLALYNNTINAVSGGRSGNVNNDWNAGKTISIGGLIGGTLVQSDSSAPVPFANNGSTFGEFSVNLTENQNGRHTHPVGGIWGSGGSGGVILFSGGSRGEVQTSSVVARASGNGAPHNNIQPSLAVGRMIRLF